MYRGEKGNVEKWKKEELTEKIINDCINVHSKLGTGFLENIYHNALKIELDKQNLLYESGKEVIIKYYGIEVGIHRIDLLVENEIIVELKTVEDLSKKYYAQVRSYLKAINKEIGLLVNFTGFCIDVRRVELERKKH